MADELKELPRSWLERKLGDLGVGMSTVGRSMAEGVAPLAEKYPVRHWLSENLLTSPLQSAGAALQDYTATPRDITPEYPYRARLFDPRQPAMIDPRTLDLAQFAAPVAGRLRNAARFALPDLKAAAIAAYGPDVSAAHVVKPRGGNWLSGTVEDEIIGLKRNVFSPEELQGVRARRGDQVFADLQRNQAPDVAVNNWLETKLNRYIKNEMATPEDPLRALAERGIFHYDPRGINADWLDDLDTARKYSSLPETTLARSGLAQNWENLSDLAINTTPARTFTPETPAYKENPWLSKVSPETQVHTLNGLDELGFSHIVDELRNALDSTSGLPRNLQLTPEQLNKVTVPQAVERVAQINAWREAQKVEAEMSRANNPATVLHKEYPTIPGTDAPNQRGLRWVELKANMPTGLPEGWSTPVAKGNTMETVSPEGHKVLGNSLPEIIKNIYRRHPDTPGNPTTALQDALKYEGDTMGHCAGGYCADVASGRKRIYSLRDAKGEPHVTIEVQPTQHMDFNKWWDKQPKELQDEINARARRGEHNGSIFESPEYLAARAELPPTIIQIKGKSNRKPNDEYLPFVQDFVRSNQWHSVGDLKNTNLIDIQRSSFPWPQDTTAEQIDALVGGMQGGTKTPRFTNETLIRKAREELGHNYVTEKEYSDWLGQQAKSLESPEGYAEGGAVEYNPSKVDDILNQIKRDMAVEASLPDMGHPDSMRLLDYARRLSVTGGGGRDDYGVGFGGRLGYNQPVGRGVTVRPYVEGHYYKPAMGGPAQKGLSGVGVNLNVPFAEGGLVQYDPNKVDELVRQLREEMYG